MGLSSFHLKQCHRFRRLTEQLDIHFTSNPIFNTGKKHNLVFLEGYGSGGTIKAYIKLLGGMDSHILLNISRCLKTTPGTFFNQGLENEDNNRHLESNEGYNVSQQ